MPSAVVPRVAWSTSAELLVLGRWRAALAGGSDMAHAGDMSDAGQEGPSVSGERGGATDLPSRVHLLG